MADQPNALMERGAESMFVPRAKVPMFLEDGWTEIAPKESAILVPAASAPVPAAAEPESEAPKSRRGKRSESEPEG